MQSGLQCSQECNETAYHKLLVPAFRELRGWRPHNAIKSTAREGDKVLGVANSQENPKGVAFAQPLVQHGQGSSGIVFREVQHALPNLVRVCLQWNV